jgi:SAM-dependent methyltransferase
MQKKFIKILCDPITGENLELIIDEENSFEVVTGKLISNSNTYEITNGIPRFVKDEGYSDNFGWQWNKWARVQFEDENAGGPMENYSKNMFSTITEFDEMKIKNKLVLDIGCGSGRFADIVNTMGGLSIALDYSNAIDAAKENVNNMNVLFIQGDALKLPLKDETIDFSYSIGVLHHTPNPRKGVEEAYRVLKKDGVFAISVYSKESLYTFSSVTFWRKVFKALWPLFGHYPPLIYSRIFGTLNHYLGLVSKYLTYPIRVFFPTMVLRDIKWSILDTFDAVTTSFQSGHTIYEVFNWFSSLGFKEIKPGNWRVNIIGRK